MEVGVHHHKHVLKIRGLNKKLCTLKNGLLPPFLRIPFTHDTPQLHLSNIFILYKWVIRSHFSYYHQPVCRVKKTEAEISNYKVTFTKGLKWDNQVWGEGACKNTFITLQEKLPCSFCLLPPLFYHHLKIHQWMAPYSKQFNRLKWLILETLFHLPSTWLSALFGCYYLPFPEVSVGWNIIRIRIKGEWREEV